MKHEDIVLSDGDTAHLTVLSHTKYKIYCIYPHIYLMFDPSVNMEGEGLVCITGGWGPELNR